MDICCELSSKLDVEVSAPLTAETGGFEGKLGPVIFDHCGSNTPNLFPGLVGKVLGLKGADGEVLKDGSAAWMQVKVG